MIISAFDEILFWDNIPFVLDFISEITEKYYPHDPKSYFEAKEKFYKRSIPTKQDFLKCIDDYVKNGTPKWVSGRNQNCDDLSVDQLHRAIAFSSPENGRKRAEQAQAIIDRSPEFWNAYSERALWKDDACVLELTVGAGLGTNCILQKMGPQNHYFGVDIDFVCAKTADALSRHYGVKGLGICASLWNLPFDDDTFDTVCSNAGLEECREISQIIYEASRVLKPHGKMVLHCLPPERSQWVKHFERYNIDTQTRKKLLRDLRIYESPEQIVELASACNLDLEYRFDDNVKGGIMVFEKKKSPRPCNC